jgi:hypothetical protein
MSESGQKRRFDRLQITSGPHPTPDISLRRINRRITDAMCQEETSQQSKMPQEACAIRKGERTCWN